MADDIYDEAFYGRFYKNLLRVLKGPNIRHAGMRELRRDAIKTSTRTRFGSHGWRAAISSRIAPKTVYLGDERVRLPKATDVQKNLIKSAPEELEKVLHLLESLPFVHLRRRMGDNDTYNPVCNLYVSVADQKNYRIAYMWGKTMAEPSRRRPGPEFIMIHIPEEHQLRQQVLVLPEYNINIALGTDYMGEDKKGFLRQAMWTADEQGMLGLHAGSKMVIVRDAKDNQLKKYGVFLFGLTATGKSTWSCHQLGLDYKNGEKTEVTQDDIVFLRKDGSAFGSEQGFFVKTDVSKDLQEAMYYALIDKSALFENVMIDSSGNPDFLDESLCANGRAVIQKNKIRIRRGWRLKRISSTSIDLPSLDDLDGLIFAFITRRNTIMPFSQELTPEQAVLAYLWGESTHSFASQPLKAGESVRIVGTDPFIVGSRARKVNRFHDIIMALVDRYPGKVRFFQYNTGGIGEILESYEEYGVKKKKMIRKVTRTPINIMAAIQRGDMRGSNRYEEGRLGTKEIVSCDGLDLAEYDIRKLYSEEQINSFLREIVRGRQKFTAEIASEGLNPEILRFAERSFLIGRKEHTLIPASPPEEEQREQAEGSPDAAVAPYEWVPKSRPTRGRGFRRR